MSQSDPTTTPKYTTLEVRLRFQNGDTMETLVAQMQKECTDILCVVDGCFIQYYKECIYLPKTLIFEHKQRHRKSTNTEYYYRCTTTDSLYAFFLDSVHNYLKLNEESSCVGRVVEMTSNGTVSSDSH